MIINTEPQNTPEWLKARLGCFSSSTMSSLVSLSSGGKPLKARASLIEQLTAERITGTIDDGFSSYPTARGNHLEDQALAEYELNSGLDVKQVGFCRHENIEHFGISPDGLIGNEGGVEIKCPKDLKKHLLAITESAQVIEHHWQVQTMLFVSSRKWWDVVSYDPRFEKEGMQLSVARVEPDQKSQNTIRSAVMAGNREIEILLSEIKNIS